MPLVLAEPSTAIFILAFVTLIVFGLINILVGIFCETSVRVTQDFDGMMDLYLDRKNRKTFIYLTKLWVLADPTGSGRVDEDGLCMTFQDPDVCVLLHGMGLHETEIRDLFRSLDRDRDGFVTIQEFIDGMLKLRQIGSNNISTHLVAQRLEHGQKILGDCIQESEGRIAEAFVRLEKNMVQRLEHLQTLAMAAATATEAKELPTEVPSGTVWLDDDIAAMLRDVYGWLQVVRAKPQKLKVAATAATDTGGTTAARCA